MAVALPTVLQAHHWLRDEESQERHHLLLDCMARNRSLSFNRIHARDSHVRRAMQYSDSRKVDHGFADLAYSFVFRAYLSQKCFQTGILSSVTAAFARTTRMELGL